MRIMSNSYALTSDITVGQIESLKSRNPDALKIKDENGNDVFAVSYAEGKDCITAFGVTFGAKSRDGSNKAVVVGTIPSGIETNEAAKAYVEEKLHKATEYLKTLEETVPAAATKVAEAKNSLMSVIEVS